jgi:hypothetical protein
MDDEYPLSPVEREYIDGLSMSYKRVESEMMGALAILCKQHGMDPNRAVYNNGVLKSVAGQGPPRSPMAPPLPLPAPAPAPAPAPSNGNGTD